MIELMVPDGTVILSKADPNAGWIMRFMAEQIQSVTNSPYIHAELILGSVGDKVQVFESTVWTKGIRIFSGLRFNVNYIARPGDVLLFPKNDLTRHEVGLMGEFLSTYVNQRARYNFLKLAALKFFYKYRETGKTIPFSNNFWGFVCSVVVAETFVAGGNKVVPIVQEYVAPADLYTSDFFRHKHITERTRLLPIH